MYEDMTMDVIMEEMMEEMPDGLDTSEGSLILSLNVANTEQDWKKYIQNCRHLLIISTATLLIWIIW